MKTFDEILERLRHAEGPDRELDFDIHDAITGLTNQYAPAYTFSLHEGLRLAEQFALECWPDILRDATYYLSHRFNWHIKYPELGQLDLLPSAVLYELVSVLKSKAGN